MHLVEIESKEKLFCLLKNKSVKHGTALLLDSLRCVSGNFIFRIPRIRWHEKILRKECVDGSGKHEYRQVTVVGDYRCERCGVIPR